MKWTVISNYEERTDYDGFVYKAKTETFECPFEYMQDVYYVYKKDRLFRKPKWVVLKTRIRSVWATNCFGVSLEYDNRCITENEFDRLFTDRESAIEFCLKKNNHSKVKIYNDR